MQCGRRTRSRSQAVSSFRKALQLETCFDPVVWFPVSFLNGEKSIGLGEDKRHESKAEKPSVPHGSSGCSTELGVRRGQGKKLEEGREKRS